VTESIGALLNDGHAPAVIELTEYALAQLESAIGDMERFGCFYMMTSCQISRILHHRRLPGRPSRTSGSRAPIF